MVYYFVTHIKNGSVSIFKKFGRNENYPHEILLLAFLAKVDLHTIVDQKMQTKKIFLLD
jgi:hypothetical protein